MDPREAGGVYLLEPEGAPPKVALAREGAGLPAPGVARRQVLAVATPGALLPSAEARLALAPELDVEVAAARAARAKPAGQAPAAVAARRAPAPPRPADHQREGPLDAEVPRHAAGTPACGAEATAAATLDASGRPGHRAMLAPSTAHYSVLAERDSPEGDFSRARAGDSCY